MKYISFVFSSKRDTLIKKKKQKVYKFHIFFQIATFLNTGVYIYVYIYMFLKTGICILYMCV